MTETQRVPAPRVPLKGRPDLALIIIVSLITVLVTKPWGSIAPPDDQALEPTVGAAAPTSPAPTPVEEGYAYSQAIFGPFEPAPEWSIWPAGFFITVLYVSRAPDDGGSGSPSPTGSPPASPGSTDEPGWPSKVTIGPGDHLLWLGIDVPVDWQVSEAQVWRLDSDGTRSAVPVVQLPSQWGPHFTVIGIPVSSGSDRLTIWPLGSYDVEVTLAPGPVMKTFRVEIQTLAPELPAGPDDR
jgi:hypothetical protein